MYRTVFVVYCFLALTLKGLSQYDVPKEAIVSAEEKARRGEKLKGYKIRLYTGIPERVNLRDTIARGAHNFLAVERRSLGVSYAGNTNQPWQSKIFFDREAVMPDFIPLFGYQSLLYNPESVLFYDTKVPLTLVHYRKNFGDNVLEELVNGVLSLNLGKHINIGVSVDHVSALGYYENNRSRNVDYRLFGSYNSDRYDLWAYISNDYYKQQEYGGVSDFTYISNPDQFGSGRVKISSQDIPVRITTPLFNRIRSGHGFLSHRYKLGYYKRDATTGKGMLSPKKGFNQSNTSPDIDNSEIKSIPVFVPVGSISHQMHYNKSSRRMIATSTNDLWSKWGEPVVNAKTNASGVLEIIPNDVTEFRTLKNTIALSLIEGFRPWVKAGLSTYLRTENYWAYALDANTQTRGVKDKFFSSFIGGELSRRSGKGLNFSTRAELAILGKDLGALLLEGDVKTKFRLFSKDFALDLDARLINHRPAYFAVHERNTWNWHNNSFDFSRRLELGARASLTSWGTWFELRTASLHNHIYWQSNARPSQSNSLIQTSMFRFGHEYQLGALAWALEGAYQVTTAPTIIPLPELSLRSDTYLDFTIARVLQVHLGLEAYWHSTYYAPVYHPIPMLFVNQQERKIGGDAPLINAYINFRMRTNRFYLRMFNAGELLFTPARETMPHYAYNPPHFELGLVIDLKN